MDQSTIIRLEDALPLDAPARLDLYGPIHKALRGFMFDTLARLGRADGGDAHEMAETLAQARELLRTMRLHLMHENTFVHPAIDARRPGGATATADDHVEHELSIDALGCALDAIEQADGARRQALLYRTYLRFARFVAENLEHMEIEETHNTKLLHDAYTDDELNEIHQRLLASISPEDMALTMRWMLVGLSHPERVGMLSDMRAHAPAPVFEGTVSCCRDLLSPRDWGKLANALGVPAGAGLVEVW